MERTLRCVQFDFIYYFSSASSHLLYFELFCLLLSCSFLLSADREDDDDEEEKRMLELDPTVPTTFTRCGLSAMHSWAQLDGYEDVSNILSGEKT